MKAGQTARTLAFVFALSLAPAAYAQQTEPPPRRPQGPAAGPVIKLPPGTASLEERTQAPGTNQEAAPAPPAPTKWEYCVINGFRYHQKGFSSSSSHTPAAFVRYLPEGSDEIEGATEEEALGNALAKLGEDGWELTAIRTDLQLKEGDGKATSVYFFKRPKRQE